MKIFKKKDIDCNINLEFCINWIKINVKKFSTDYCSIRNDNFISTNSNLKKYNIWSASVFFLVIEFHCVRNLYLLDNINNRH